MGEKGELGDAPDLFSPLKRREPPDRAISGRNEATGTHDIGSRIRFGYSWVEDRSALNLEIRAVAIEAL